MSCEKITVLLCLNIYEWYFHKLINIPYDLQSLQKNVPKGFKKKQQILIKMIDIDLIAIFSEPYYNCSSSLDLMLAQYISNLFTKNST